MFCVAAICGKCRSPTSPTLAESRGCSGWRRRKVSDQEWLRHGGDGFFSHARAQGRCGGGGQHIIPCLHFFKRRSAHVHQFHSGSHDQSTVAQPASWDDWGWVFPDELHVSSFPWWIPTLCLDSIVSPCHLHAGVTFELTWVAPGREMLDVEVPVGSHWLVLICLWTVYPDC